MTRSDSVILGRVASGVGGGDILPSADLLRPFFVALLLIQGSMVDSYFTSDSVESYKVE